MIPISAEERIKVEDSGVTYLVQPITGSNEVEYISLIDKPSGEGLEEKINRVDSIFNWFVKGWEGVSIKFPEDGKPSKFLRATDKNRILDKIHEATKLSEQDQKN